MRRLLCKSRVPLHVVFQSPCLACVPSLKTAVCGTDKLDSIIKDGIASLLGEGEDFGRSDLNVFWVPTLDSSSKLKEWTTLHTAVKLVGADDVGHRSQTRRDGRR